MNVEFASQIPLARRLRTIPRYLSEPVRLLAAYQGEYLRHDLVAGITVAVVGLPQAIAFALIAGLPAEVGLYAAIVSAIIAALWGSSSQVHTGPANAVSLLVFSTLTAVAAPNTATYIFAAALLAIMAGIFQFVLGVARLGLIVNFVSHSVIIGFTAGAGILIAIGQLGPLFGLNTGGVTIVETLADLVRGLAGLHVPTAALGVGTILLIIFLDRLNRKLPTALIAMVVASVIVFLLGLNEAGVSVIGQLPAALPPLTDFSRLNLELIGRLSTGALAAGAIGLVQTAAIARSISTQTGQRLDSNQEFVGQGLANIVTGLFSGYPVAGSFSRSAVNLDAGARTRMAAIFSSLFVLIALVAVGWMAAYLPRAALAGVLIATAFNLIDMAEIRRIWRGTPGDAAIMVVTFMGTLLLPIEFAVLAGILLSFAVYIMRTSTPRVQTVLPDDDFRHFLHQPEKPPCPQLGIIDILGDLYFGAVNHVEEAILRHRERHPEQRYLLIRMDNVNQCDFSGIHMLENIARIYREDGGDIFLVRCGPRVEEVIEATAFDKFLGEDNILTGDKAIGYLFHHILDPAVCIYECSVRAFRECQNLPKRPVEAYDSKLPRRHETANGDITEVDARELWQLLRGEEERPLVVDVRQPREYRVGHIAAARLLPLPELLEKPAQLPDDAEIILVCRSGRRSRRAAIALHQRGYKHVTILKGGMLEWEAAGLLQAVEWSVKRET